MRRGFTLIELMVTIVILGGLVSIVGLNVFGAQRTADLRTAGIQMANLGSAVKMWTLRHRRLPESLEVLVEVDPYTGEPLLETLPKDPWRTPYGYERLGGTRFRIQSAGPDGQPGTEDDLEWPGDAADGS